MSFIELQVQKVLGTFKIELELSSAADPLVVAGPNGAGKTSLLLMILGIISPDAGKIAIGGRVLFDSAADTNVPPEDRHFGYVPQHFGLFPHMTAVENVAFALECKKIENNPQKRRDRAKHWLDQLGVQNLADQFPFSLSGGERQKVALARAMATEPTMLVLDEPLTTLDISARRSVREFLKEQLKKLNRPAIIVTHDPADAMSFGKSVAMMEAGQLVQFGTFEELKQKQASPFVQAFLETRA